MTKKRRTKKQKINPKYPYSISWNPAKIEANVKDSEANVKRHLTSSSEGIKSGKNQVKFADSSEENTNLISIKKNIVRSLIFAFLIIASEVVIYLIWK